MGGREGEREGEGEKERKGVKVEGYMHVWNSDMHYNSNYNTNK